MASRRHAKSGSPYEERFGFSRGVRSGDRIEIAGTAPIPRPGEALAPTAYEQMLRCGEIAIAALQELGASAEDVIRTRTYITDPSDADEIGRAHRELFGAASPAATMVAVVALVDSAWKVELEVEAQLGS
jgi:enamine deaminase RidA (YjgF/YER057c/UK114 family)